MTGLYCTRTDCLQPTDRFWQVLHQKQRIDYGLCYECALEETQKSEGLVLEPEVEYLKVPRCIFERQLELDFGE